ncbi:MAG: hypothetical protein OEW59_10540, partial [Gammaproteobacteria bacterium]|nr:hypothetical protein [Gammaproteobacteria bacterium]
PPYSIAPALLLILFVSLIGGAITSLRRGGFTFPYQKVAFTALAVGALGILGGLYAIFSDKDSANPLLDDFALEDRTLDLPNPGLPGDYPVLTLTYGSGKDLRREEYGDAVTIAARRVDGSKLIDNWDGFSGWLRTSYWGFDATGLPLQARVWYPDGDGPFPVVLVVHGNHGMEDFSDPGYAYLGELFASRGIIFASVDQNYINSSVASLVEIWDGRPGLKEENDARGWLLLEHLRLWRDWNEDPGHRFYGKVDIDRVALIGHSRGGEAVGVAAAFNALDRYPDDASVDFDFGFNLRGVIAIAPVYGQYEPRERPTPVRDVNYFTIHGDMDGDVQSFEGMAQYSRVTFPGEDFRFRAGLYVVGANHGQFNTTWENLDTGLFRAWALDLGGIMDAEAQRDVARVYFGAFLEVVLNDRREYLPMFRDARYAAKWLPRTYFINQYSDSRQVVLADFEDDIDPATLTTAGGSIETQNLSRWYETGNSLKYDELDTHSMVVAWDPAFSAETARVDFKLPEPVGGDALVIAASAIDVETLPDDWEREESTEPDEVAEPEPLDWTIEVEYGDGRTDAFPLSRDSMLYPLVNAVPRRAGFLDGEEPTEVLFRRFEFPNRNRGTEPGSDPQVVRVSFLFDRSPKGAIIVDDISIAHYD